MITIGVGIALLVALIVTLKMMRMVASGCMKLVVVAILLGGCAVAYWYFKNKLVLP